MNRSSLAGFDPLGDSCELQADKTVLRFIVQRGFHPKLGARPMRDAIEKLIGDAVAKNLMTKKAGHGTLTLDETETYFRIVPTNGKIMIG